MANFKHIATHGIYSPYGTGHRIGTRYIYKLEDIEKVREEPNFRWRNRDWETAYIKWQFDKANEAQG